MAPYNDVKKSWIRSCQLEDRELTAPTQIVELSRLVPDEERGGPSRRRPFVGTVRCDRYQLVTQMSTSS